MNAILLIGACGSGKTWVCKELIKKFKLNKLAKIKTIYFNTNNKISVMGKYTGHIYDGSDRLSMSVMKDINYLKYIQEKHKMLIIAEGDRFMNKTFITKFNPYIIKINNDGLKGRKKRNSSQSDRQIKTINTRVSNIKHNISVTNSFDAYSLIQNIINEKIKTH